MSFTGECVMSDYVSFCASNKYLDCLKYCWPRNLRRALKKWNAGEAPEKNIGGENGPQKLFSETWG